MHGTQRKKSLSISEIVADGPRRWRRQAADWPTAITLLSAIAGRFWGRHILYHGKVRRINDNRFKPGKEGKQARAFRLQHAFIDTRSRSNGLLYEQVKNTVFIELKSI